MRCFRTPALFALGLLLLVTTGCQSTRVPHMAEASPRADTLATAPLGPRLAEPGPNDGRHAFLISLGRRNLDEQYWEPLDKHISFGLEYAYLFPGSAFGIEVGFHGSADTDEETLVVGSLVENVDITATAGEISIGGRLDLPLEGTPMRFYVGGGPSFIRAELEAEVSNVVVSDDDTSIGLYAHAGLLFQLSGALIGLDARILRGSDIELFDVSADVDYEQIALVVGFSW